MELCYHTLYLLRGKQMIKRLCRELWGPTGEGGGGDDRRVVEGLEAQTGDMH